MSVLRRLADRRVALAGVVLLALVVRLAGIGDRLTADEGYSWLVAAAPDAGAFLDRLAAFENTPPLLYLLLAPLPLLDGEAWLRVPSLVAAVASVPVLYAIVRPLAGTRAALLAALGLAVAPYHVAFSNYSRGFLLAGFGLLVAMWAAARLAQGGRRRWWWLYAAGAVVALYSEYYAGLTLAAIVGTLLAIGTPPRREALALGAAPVLAFLPWLPEIVHALEQVDVTKAAPIYPPPTPAIVRDELVPLFFGEHGSGASAALRTLQLGVIAALLAAAAALLWRRETAGAPAASRAAASARLARTSAAAARPPLLTLLAGAGLGTLVLHGMLAYAGPDVFAVRYLTVLIPLAAALLAAGIAAFPWRRAMPLASAVLLALAVAVFAQRHDRELEPDLRPVAAQLPASGAEVALTNSAVVVYYLEQAGLRPLLDRPFGLGRGLEAACAERCAEPFAVVDDSGVAGGARAGPGVRSRVGGVVVRIVEPQSQPDTESLAGGPSPSG